MTKIAFITGTTAGIGEATTTILAQNGYQLIITGRREEKLLALAEKITQETGQKILPLSFDVRQKEAVYEAIDSLPAEWKNIDLLINNAGLAAGAAPIHESDIDDWERMIDTNIKGLLYVSRKIMPMMVERKKGHIINIGSVAGKEVYANGNVYCGTKHAVDAITKSMRIDLLTHGIKVSQVAPGAVETEFSVVRFHGDQQAADNVYKGFDPLMAQDIADAVLYIATRPAHVNINDMLIMPTAQANTSHIDKKLDSEN